MHLWYHHHHLLWKFSRSRPLRFLWNTDIGCPLLYMLQSFIFWIGAFDSCRQFSDQTIVWKSYPSKNQLSQNNLQSALGQAMSHQYSIVSLVVYVTISLLPGQKSHLWSQGQYHWRPRFFKWFSRAFPRIPWTGFAEALSRAKWHGINALAALLEVRNTILRGICLEKTPSTASASFQLNLDRVKQN